MINTLSFLLFSHCHTSCQCQYFVGVILSGVVFPAFVVVLMLLLLLLLLFLSLLFFFFSMCCCKLSSVLFCPHPGLASLQNIDFMSMTTPFTLTLFMVLPLRLLSVFSCQGTLSRYSDLPSIAIQPGLKMGPMPSTAEIPTESRWFSLWASPNSLARALRSAFSVSIV